MTVITSSNEFDGHIQYLKETLGFSQVFVTETVNKMIFFEGFKDGETYKVRYLIEDDDYQLWSDNQWR